MAGKSVRAVIAGASSMLAKELAERLTESTAAVWDLTLLDVGADGQVTAAGDEALVVMPLEAAGFSGADVVFFAGSAAATRKHWRDALTAGACVVDMTAALQNEDGVLTLAPGVSAARADLQAVAVAPADPAVQMLGLVWKRLVELSPSAKMMATVMLPASVLGSEGMDELHQQTVALLSFQSLNKDVYDTQVAFTLSDRFGAEAKTPFATLTERARTQMLQAVGDGAWSVEWLQAPVFHGMTASAWVELGEGVELEAVESALKGDGLLLVDEAGDDEVSNLAATGQDDVLVRVRRSAGKLSGFWLWMAADNLRMAARSAMGCAGELLALKPGSTLQ